MREWRRSRWLPRLLVALAALLTLGSAGLVGLGGAKVVESLVGGTVFMGLAFAGVGALLVAKRPENPIGLMFAVAGLLFLVQAVSDAYCDDVYRAGVHLPAARYVANPTQWIFAPAMIFGFVLPFLRFPDGDLPSPRWRWVGRAGWIGMTAATVDQVVQPGRLNNYPAANPLGVHLPAGFAAMQFGIFLYVAATIAAVVAVAGRYRRSQSTARVQMRWFVYGAAITTVSLVAQVVSTLVTGDVGLWVVLLVAMPICMGVAILRYRLYDIDRVVSRTVGYVLVSAVVLVPYLVLVVGVGTVSGSPLAVAALTLVVVAAFRPLHRRVQQRVDRRFNRRRYDAGRTVEAFAARLRELVDVDALQADLALVVARTVEPRTLSMWTRAASGR